MKQTVKKIETLAIILIVLGIISKISSPLMSMLTGLINGAGRQQNSISLEGRTMLTVWIVLSMLVNIGVAVWLFVSSKQDRRSKWIWALFGFVYGLTAAVLYFLVDVIDEIRRQKTVVSDQASDSPNP